MTDVLRFCLSALQVVVVFLMFAFVLSVLFYFPKLRFRNQKYKCVRLQMNGVACFPMSPFVFQWFLTLYDVLCFCSSALQVSIVFRYVCFRLCFSKLNFATKLYFIKVTSKQVNLLIKISPPCRECRNPRMDAARWVELGFLR